MFVFLHRLKSNMSQNLLNKCSGVKSKTPQAYTEIQSLSTFSPPGMLLLYIFGVILSLYHV